MYTSFPTKAYKKSFKRLMRSGKFDERELDLIIDTLASGEDLGREYQDHELHGEYAGCRECHVRGDTLLIYRIEDKRLVLILIDIGSHSRLFG